MARFNEILAGRYNRFLQKLLQLKGGPPSAQLASEVMPVLTFFNGVENRYLEGWERFILQFDQPAVAANFGDARVRNPLTSGVIIVIEKVNVINIAGVTDQPGLLISKVSTDLATALGTGQLDTRTRLNSAAIVSRTAGAAPAQFSLISQVAVGSLPYDFINDENQELTLLPGQALDVLSNVANQRLTGSVLWRERALEESELK